MSGPRVAVVGAGLAGSVAAWRLARAGLEPVLFERAEEPGAAAACGGVMLYSLGQHLEIEHMAHGGVTEVRIEGVRRPFAIRFQRPIFVTFDRGRLDRELALRAAREGCRLRTGCTVTGWRPGTGELCWIERGRHRSERFGAVIFADGPKTVARRYGFGVDPDAPLGGAFYRELAWNDPDVSWTSFSLSLPPEDPGYFWVFPKGARIQVGVGRLHGERRTSLRLLVDRFVEADPSLRNLPVACSRGGIIPFRPARSFSRNEGMAVGDAAGLVNPITGGGLVYAAASGEMAARALMEAWRRGLDGAWAAERYASRLERSVHLTWLRALQIPFAGQVRRLRGGQRPYFLPLFLLYARVLPRLTPVADAITLRRPSGSTP